MEPFHSAVPDEVLSDLKQRLRNTRWPSEIGNDDWRYGTRLTELQTLCDYWANEYDWRRHETAINALPNFRSDIDGIPIHFIRVPGKGPRPMPLVLSHGWPWTFWDLHKVIGPLSDPVAHGGDAADAFDVVVPSLPGYGFSSPLTKTGINAWRTADLWDRLMREVLGYERYAAQGGDWGAILSAQLGHKHAAHLYGVHLTLTLPLGFPNDPFPPHDCYAEDEAHWCDRTALFFAEGSGYSAIQGTRPQTLAYGMHDSPAALCAWILEKRRAWSDCGGDVLSRFTLDDLCTTMTIYWVTETFVTSARYYYEFFHQPWQPVHERRPVVEAPTSIAVFPGELFMVSRSWAESYYNLKRWTPMPQGGHFAPMEEPALLVDDIRASFRAARAG
jgi:pimeloyl-ACP methyl ester carboxylesterase